MENNKPCSSKNAASELRNAEDINELNDLQDVKVWSHSQDDIEKQALQQLEILFNKNKEEGEVSDDEEQSKSDTNSKPATSTLDINDYIKRQEELAKIQEYKKSLLVSEKSKAVAATVSQKQASRHKNGKKSKIKQNPKQKKVNLQPNEIKIFITKGNPPLKNQSESEYFPSDGNSSDSDYEQKTSISRKRKVKNTLEKNDDSVIKKIIDDGNAKAYENRLERYYEQIENENNLLNICGEDGETTNENIDIVDGISISRKVWEKLFEYQQDGIKWMCKIHQESVGCLLGDEMGLGKTVQVIAFLYAVNYSRMLPKHGRFIGLGPTIIICPATVIHQWVQHFHEWAPEFRVAVLHQSGSYEGNKINLIKEINKDKGILIVTYSGILKFKGNLCELNWHYLILDEGHKIRNPSAKISVAVKEIRTPHRVILTGSPMQNNLQELWSLFDFISPGLLGTLPIFIEHFCNPIMQGGYFNATPMQEATALSMATALKNIISPYMLRRTKSEVQHHIFLPNKKEQVLFCKLSSEQNDLYKGYLMSEHVSMMLGRGRKNWYSENHMKANVFVAITTLRKICNHPDLYLGEFDDNNASDGNQDSFGYYKRSGKMIVVSALLKVWKKQQHRVLLFAQTRGMIAVFEIFLQQQGYKFLKLDGSTSINSRQSIIDRFNQDSSYDIFLSTTRVGGLGVNLTGANRVIIYDPDWNPATDTQARERAWRIGQEKDVTIYRLLSAGTIEEKMYQRQVWKQLLSNKVLIDPRTQRFFKTSDLHDLFSLQEHPDESNIETGNLFKNSRIALENKMKEKKKKRKHKLTDCTFTKDKIQEMHDLAQKIAKTITANDNVKETKSVIKIEMEIEKQEKLTEKEYMKTLTPVELRMYNKKKLEKTEDGSINKIDDIKTTITFSKALELSGETAKLHTDLQQNKEVFDVLMKLNAEKVGDNKTKDKTNEDSIKKHKNKEKVVVDDSGQIEGEKIDSLVKTEIRKQRRRKHKSRRESETQDEYVLNKLFSKKGIQSALQHDVIVQSNNNQNTIRIESEAKMKADLALQALKKSRLNNWKW